MSRLRVENLRHPDATVDSITISNTGSVSLPASTSIGNVSSTELGYVDGVTSAIQTQFNDLGKWQNWTPTITQGSALSKTINRARYTQIGKLVMAYCAFTVTSAGTAGQGISVSLPVSAVAANSGYGSFRWFDAGNTNYAGTSRVGTTTLVIFNINGNGNNLGIDQTLANNDFFEMNITYEAE